MDIIVETDGADETGMLKSGKGQSGRRCGLGTVASTKAGAALPSAQYNVGRKPSHDRKG